MALSQYFYDAQLTPVRLVSTANVSATYDNGATNNGLGATLTVAASSLAVDSVDVVVGDRVLLADQTNQYENGIYHVTSIGSTVVLTRAEDFQSLEQMRLGQWVTSFAGTVNTGRSFVFTTKPAKLGINTLDFSSAQVAVSGATVTNQIPVAADTVGTIKSSTGVAATLGGSLQADGDIIAGEDADAAKFVSYPATTASGTLIFEAIDNSADVDVTVRNASHGQATVYSIPDVGAATGSILVSTVAADPNANLIWFDVTVGQAALAAAGTVTLVDSSGTKQYKVRELMHNDGGTNFSGGGGDRLGQVGDGTSIYAITPAASLQTVVNARWGSTAIAFPTAIAANTSTAAGADLVYAYNGGAADYTAGSMVVSGMVQRVA